MSRLLLTFRRLLPVLAALLALGLGGCGDPDRLAYASELDEPDYREGQALLKAGRRQEALSAFLKVIDKRRDDAPESQLEVGLLYVQHINDPLSAIYHFRKYLALRPNSPQAPLVRQRINAAIREFARTLPAQPLEGQAQRVDLVATLDRLKQDNEALKQQLADAKAARALPVSSPANEAVSLTATPAVTTAPANNLTFTVETVPTVRTRPEPVAPSRSTPAPVVKPPTPRATTPAPSSVRAPGPRKHIVRAGDTLSKLAQQYYNNRAKWRDIYAANRNVMKSESDMKVGTELKIP